MAVSECLLFSFNYALTYSLLDIVVTLKKVCNRSIRTQYQNNVIVQIYQKYRNSNK